MHFLKYSLISMLVVSSIFGGILGPAPRAHAAPSLDSLNAAPPFHFKKNRAQQNPDSITPSTASPEGLTPSQIRGVYNLPSSGGTGTIALIEAYDNPNAESDLGAFDTQFGIASCTTGNGCFEKHKMSGTLSTDTGWTLESSLDVQWAHAVAPGAKILVVEAKNSSLTNLLAAVDYARSRSDVVAVSMSWDSSEFSGESAYDFHFVSPYGATFFSSAGDSGAGVLWPAVSSNVVSVGGTTLTFASTTFSSETAWNGSGGGLSSFEPEPGYQSTFGVASTSGFRATPDVSYNADPNSGFSVYDSTGYGGENGWMIVGGTSAGSPQWAAIQALGHTASNATLYTVAANNTLYATDFRDITSGVNGACGYYCSAGTKYDYVTGLGSPHTYNFQVPVSNASITPATGGLDVPVDTTSHAGGTGSWTSLTGPTIAETALSQIATGVHTLILPIGWEVNTGHSITAAATGISLSATTLTPNATSTSFTVSAASTSTPATITFSGIQIRPTVSTAPSVGNILHSGAAISGVSSSTSFGTISIDSGAAVSVAAETLANGLGTTTPIQNLSSSATTTAYAVTRDQFGNFIANVPATWSLTSKTGGVVDGDLVASDDTENATLAGGVIGSAKIHTVIGGLTSIDSGVITVVPGAAASLVLSPPEATTTADTTLSFTATGTDAHGNTANVTASTTFSISAGAHGSFSGATYTPQSVGDWTVTGTDGAATSSALLHVTPGAATQLTFTVQPSSAQAGANLSTTVAALDASGNIATGYAGAVTIALHGNPGVLQGTVTTSAVAGIASFASANVSQVGSGYTLDAFASGLTSTTSAASFAITAIPSSGGGGGGGGGGNTTIVPTLPKKTSTTTPATATTVLPTATIAATTATPVTTLSFTRELGTGMSGNDVLALQQFLNTHGFVISTTGLGSPGNESSSFGTKTKIAVAKFQAANGLPATGYVGPKTLAVLDSLQGAASVTTPIASIAPMSTPVQPASSLTRDLTLGSMGSDVSALQNFLITQNKGPAAATLAASSASGYFGAVTRAALKEYQAVVGISPATGYLGPRTRASIQL